MKDLRIRLAGGDEVSAGFAIMMKDKDWSGQKVAMFILKQYFSKPVEESKPAGTEVAFVVKKKAPAKKFARPSLIEIQQEFQDKGSRTCLDDADTFFNHYESNGWKVGKNSMKNWKATVAQWHKRNKESKNGQAASGAISVISDTDY